MVEITHTVKEKQPIKKWLFLFLKDRILGKKYDLSLAFVGETISKKTNSSTRGKDYPTNILSFPYDDKSGEILICPNIAKKEYKKFDMSYPDFLIYLFIHGCLHLKGLDHGDEMEKLEDKYLILALKQKK
jgi:probable rRNA maturation factor